MNQDPKIIFTPTDLEEAAQQGLITSDQADELVRWGYRRLYEDPNREVIQPRASMETRRDELSRFMLI